MSTNATGTFSFTFSAEWDFVPGYNRETYLKNQYAIPLEERLDMCRTVQLLLASGNWAPYAPVHAVTIDGYLAEENESHKPLFSEYLYFNSHMRRLIYNQTDVPKEIDNSGVPGKAESGENTSDAPAATAKACARKQRSYAKDVDQNGDPVVVLRHRLLDQDREQERYATYHLFRYCEDQTANGEVTPMLREYLLPISSVELRLYAVGVMLLTIRCQDEETTRDPYDPEKPVPIYTQRLWRIDENGYFKKGAAQPVHEASDLAWIESCGRRLFSARMCPGGGFGSMADEFPLFSYLQYEMPGAESRQQGKAGLRGDEIVLCDFRSLLAKPYANELSADQAGELKALHKTLKELEEAAKQTDKQQEKQKLLAFFLNITSPERQTTPDEKTTLHELHHILTEFTSREMQQVRLLPLAFGTADETIQPNPEEEKALKKLYNDLHSLWAQTYLPGKQRKLLQNVFGQEANSRTQPERLDFLSRLLAPACISKTNLNRLLARPTPEGRDDPPAAVQGDLLVLDCFNDDRMYLHGSVVSKDIYNRTRRGWDHRDKRGDCDLKEWYAILYADTNWKYPTHQDPGMLVSLVEQATDARWYEWGTFHGMTYHSMVMLTKNAPPAFLQANHDWHYLQMFLIAILQRCSIQRFYREAAGLLRTKPWRSNTLRNAVQNKYTLFLNQFWFFEVTEQEQGKMLFSKLQQAMNIERDVQFLDSALEEINQQNANKLSNMVNKLLLPLSIIGGLWTMVDVIQSLSPDPQPGLWQQLLGASSKAAAPQPAPTAFPALNWAFLLAIGLCVGIYIWNQFGYIRQTCTGILSDLKRLAKKWPLRILVKLLTPLRQKK